MRYGPLEILRPEIRGRVHGHRWPPYDPHRSGHRNGRLSQAVDPAQDRGNARLGVTVNRKVSAGTVSDVRGVHCLLPCSQSDVVQKEITLAGKLEASVTEITGFASITLKVDGSSIKIVGEGIILVTPEYGLIKLN
jgi:hypothetical protein